jgi:hypothetical protein
MQRFNIHANVFPAAHDIVPVPAIRICGLNARGV